MSRSGLVTLALGCALALSALVWNGTAFAAGAEVTTATDAQKQAASAKFQAASEALEAKKYEDALTAFRESYAVVASPNTHLMIGRALVELGRLAEAYEELAAAAAEAKAAAAKDRKYAAAGESARSDMSEVATRIAFVRVQFPSEGEVDALRVAGRVIPKARWATFIPVDPGQVKLVVQRKQGDDEREVTLAAGASETITVEHGASSPGQGGGKTHKVVNPTRRTAAYVCGGVGVLGLITFAVEGSGKALGNFGLVFGVLGLGSGTALWFASTTNVPDEPPKPKTALVLGPGSLGFVGSF